MRRDEIEILKQMLRNMREGNLGWGGAVITQTETFEKAIKELEIPSLTGGKNESKM